METSSSSQFLGFDLVPLRGDKLSRLFAFVFALMAFVGALYALRQERTTELAAAFVYAGSAIGVALAGDLISVFVFWEMMAIGSTLVVWCGGPAARRRGPALCGHPSARRGVADGRHRR